MIIIATYFNFYHLNFLSIICLYSKYAAICIVNIYTISIKIYYLKLLNEFCAYYKTPQHYNRFLSMLF